jgi:hypothetical protein
MSFSTLYPDAASLIVADSPVGTLTKSPLEIPHQARAGDPDRLHLKYEGLAFPANPFTGLGIGTTPTGIRTPGSWFIVDATPRYEPAPWCTVDVTCEGLLSGDGTGTVRRRHFSVTEQQNAEMISYLGTIWPRVQVRVQQVGVELDYVLIGDDPPTESVGLQIVPGSAPPVAPSLWTFIVDPVRHIRDGWVLDRVRSQNIGGRLDAWLVTEVYLYIYPYSP